MMTKAEIRKEVKNRLANTGSDVFAVAGEKIQGLAVSLPEFQNAEIVLSYLALPQEVSTDLIIKKAWESGKKVCVPALRDDGEGYGVAELIPEDKLIAGGLSVPEPGCPRWMDLNSVDIAFIPGVAFDESGGRLGHGAGHIDRMLAERIKPGLFKVGLAFSLQIFERVPQNEFDVKMDKIVFD